MKNILDLQRMTEIGRKIKLIGLELALDKVDWLAPLNISAATQIFNGSFTNTCISTIKNLSSYVHTLTLQAIVNVFIIVNVVLEPSWIPF